MRILFTLLAYLASLLVMAALAFSALMALANSAAVPALVKIALDGGLLLLVGWAIVLIVPAWVAWRVWERLRRNAGHRNKSA